ncbi:MAG: late competence development ComFB family protein [Leptolyngbyaceae cyanobacterium SM2_5_2]|nr:late competence development ComFB family protein [Leptolyngbyaceae cyanobacterium SM2_5_2]
MKIVHDVSKRAYINVMELLVAEEVEKQIAGLPPRVLKYLKGIEVETYALNRLPALYASSEKGWQHQYEKAKRELRNQIKSAVRQALAAVQVDPIRSSEPLNLGADDAASKALESLREILKQPDLSWDGAINRLRVVLTHRGNQGQDPRLASSDTSHRTRYRQPPVDHSRVSNSGNSTADATLDSRGHYWRPGTYGSEVSWQKSHNQTPRSSEFDWSDPRYSK